MQTPQTLGKLVKEDPRNYWKNEASDFTPWLATEENMALLSEAIGVDLIIEETESAVGNFSLDILAKEDGTGIQVIIENQLEETNHDHLGKLLTYAAGKEAKIIIWIVKHAREEHRRAIEWLNQNTTIDIRFYLIEIELWRIGNSPYAPNFSVIERPNEWSKNVRQNTNLSDGDLFLLSFWEAFNNYASNDPDFTKEFRLRNAGAQNWYDLAIGTSSCHICLEAKPQKKEATVGLYIPDDKELYQRFLADKDAIEDALGDKATWKEASKSTRFFISIDIQMKDQSTWDSIFKWICDNAINVKNIVKPYLFKKL